jgi:hypothetical protein
MLGLIRFVRCWSETDIDSSPNELKLRLGGESPGIVRKGGSIPTGESWLDMSPVRLGLGRPDIEGDGYPTDCGRKLFRPRMSVGADVTPALGMPVAMDCARPTGSVLWMPDSPL